MQYLKFIAVLFLFSTLLSCFRDVIIDDSDNVFPIELRLSGNRESLNLSWDTFSSSAFKKYILVRSINPIVAGQTPKPGSNPTILTEITNRNLTSFQDHVIATNLNFHYKLYVDIGGRFLESQNLTVENNIHFFDYSISPPNIFYSPEDHFAIIPSQTLGNRVVKLFDISSRAFTHESLPLEVFLGGVTTPTVHSFHTESSGKKSLYFVWNSYIMKLSVPELVLVPEVSVPNINLSPAFSLLAINNFLVYAYRRDVLNATNIYTLPDFNSSFVSGREFWNEKRLLMPYDGDNVVAELAKGFITTFRIKPDASEQIIKTVVLHEKNDVLNEVAYSKNKKYIVFTKNGSLYDWQFNMIKPGNCTTCLKFFFSDDGEYLYSLSQILTSSINLKKYSLPDYTLVADLNISATSVNVIPTKTGIGVFGVFSSAGNSFYKEINF